MAITRSPYSPSTPQSYNAHNTIVNKVIDGVNNHTHDPNQTTDTTSSGSYIPQFGSGDSRYNTVGPGSAAWGGIGTGTYKAAIPADPGETAIDPITGSVMTTGTASTYSAISYGHGVSAELARIRGQLSKLTGQKWYTPVSGVVSFSAGGSGRDLTVGTLTATTVAYNPPNNTTAPFNITFGGTGAPPMVGNLNAQYVNGFAATTSPGTSSTLIATNAQGLLGQGTIAADSSETVVYNSTLSTTNTIQDNLANIRYVLQQWSKAAYGSSGSWNTAANSTVPMVTSLNASGSVITGSVQLISGAGISVTQTGTNTIRFDSTGVAPFTDAPVLNYPDMMTDTVIAGSLSVSNTALQITVNSGMFGYVNGTRTQPGALNGTYGPYTVVANSTNYLWWNGSGLQSSFVVNQTGTSPGSGWVLAATGTLTAGATNASQTTSGGSWTIITKKPILNTKPTITGSKSSGAALISLLAQLNAMGFIIDQTTA